ncbi:hypothetical protein ACFQPA_18195 [Halomarina halobia]|uniref:DUF4404 family protein n=1 Tax=Halomarina halobia TaxID=3033386 RepID=A0ABD6ADP5_9EURY|nr:hypothetical protein [Halomarina sp. PSR21]
MADRPTRIREELQRASDTANEDRDVREQLRSLDEGLMELVGGDKTEDEPPHEDRLAELEEKLAGLRDRSEGETSGHIRNAERLLGEYRERRETDE